MDDSNDRCWRTAPHSNLPLTRVSDVLTSPHGVMQDRRAWGRRETKRCRHHRSGREIFEPIRHPNRVNPEPLIGSFLLSTNKFPSAGRGIWARVPAADWSDWQVAVAATDHLVEALEALMTVGSAHERAACPRRAPFCDANHAVLFTSQSTSTIPTVRFAPRSFRARREMVTHRGRWRPVR